MYVLLPAVYVTDTVPVGSPEIAANASIVPLDTKNTVARSIAVTFLKLLDKTFFNYNFLSHFVFNPR